MDVNNIVKIKYFGLLGLNLVKTPRLFIPSALQNFNCANTDQLQSLGFRPLSRFESEKAHNGFGTNEGAFSLIGGLNVNRRCHLETDSIQRSFEIRQLQHDCH